MHTRKEKLEAFGRLLDVQHRLRRECPWDRKQTLDSLRANTIEEVFELADALQKHDYREIMKELGDVMEHVMFYTIIGNEAEEFDVADVCNHEADKLMFRHPFIDWRQQYGEWGSDNEPFTVSSPDMRMNDKGQVVYRADGRTLDDTPDTDVEVEMTWEQIKQREQDGNKTVLSGVPSALPSLIKAYRIQDKARNVGFDWQDRRDVWRKVREELDELEAELERSDADRSEQELGDYLFSVINAARLYHLNPDNALERTNRKFISRFGYIEQKVREAGRDFGDMTLAEMDRLWDEAKQMERNESK